MADRANHRAVSKDTPTSRSSRRAATFFPLPSVNEAWKLSRSKDESQKTTILPFGSVTVACLEIFSTRWCRTRMRYTAKVNSALNSFVPVYFSLFKTKSLQFVWCFLFLSFLPPPMPTVFESLIVEKEIPCRCVDVLVLSPLSSV